MSKLIEACVCGAYTGFLLRDSPNGLPVAECGFCGVIHLITDATRADIARLYRGEYHASLDRHPGVIPYRERYDHDRHVARLRLSKYRHVLNGKFDVEGFHALDVGAANGAWVDELAAEGLRVTGVDPDPGMTRPPIAWGTIEAAAGLGPFTLVTYHDVLEHLVDPVGELRRVRELIRQGGAIIVDVPDVFDPAGVHHYKTEHLWYFTRDAVAQMLWRAGFWLHAIEAPIPGKFVVYGVAK